MAPRWLVAKGPISAFDATNATWLRLPMPRASPKAGVYWIGVLFEYNTTCFDAGIPLHTAIGPGSTTPSHTTPLRRGLALAPARGRAGPAAAASRYTLPLTLDGGVRVRGGGERKGALGNVTRGEGNDE